MNPKMRSKMVLIDFFEEENVKFERAQNGRASPEKGHVM